MSDSRFSGRIGIILAFAAGILAASILHRIDLRSSDDSASASLQVDAALPTIAAESSVEDSQAVAPDLTQRSTTGTRIVLIANSNAIEANGLADAPSVAANDSYDARSTPATPAGAAQRDIASARGSADATISSLYGRLAEQSFLAPSCWNLDISNAHVAARDYQGDDSTDADFVITSIPDVQAVGRRSWAWQTIRPDVYRGRRIVVSAQLRSQAVDEHAFMWVSADDANGNPLAFDGMGSSFVQYSADSAATLTGRPRTLQGNNAWSWQQIVIDIPNTTYSLSYGFALIGNGALWADDVSIEIVDESAPVTGLPGRGVRPPFLVPPIRELTLPKPVNTGFESAGFIAPASCIELAEFESANG